MLRVFSASASAILVVSVASGCASSPRPSSDEVPPPDSTSMQHASSFRATGNEPGWRLDITEDSMTLLLDYGQSRVVAATPPVQMMGDRRRYGATTSEGSLTAIISDSICMDTMTGMPHPNAVTVESRGSTLHGCGGDPAALLRGPEWVVEDLEGGAVVDRSRMTLRFGDDGRISGRASCNSYFGTYTLTGERLVVSRIGATKMACAPALMTQESKFLDVLGNVHHFSLSPDGALILHTADGRTLTGKRG